MQSIKQSDNKKEARYIFINTACGLEVFLNDCDKQYYIKKDIIKDTASFIIDLIDDCLTKSGLKKTELDFLGVCVGPGSFTGIRIGVNTIKALALVLGIPIVPINSLKLNAYNIIDSTDNNKSINGKGVTKYFDNNQSKHILSVVDGASSVLYVAKYCKDGVELKEILAPQCILVDDFFELAKDCDRVVFDSTLTANRLSQEFLELKQSRIHHAITCGMQNALSTQQLQPLYIRKPQPDRGVTDI